MKHIAARLRAAREAAKYTQRTLALELGISEAMITRYETGETRVPPERLFEFASILRVPTTYFLEELPGDVERSDSAMYLAVGRDAGAKHLLTLYQQAPKTVRKQLIAYAEYLVQK